MAEGTCHICKQPADGRPMFQTRFCEACLRRGLDTPDGVSSPYAIVRALFRIQTTYDDICADIERSINSFLSPASSRGKSGFQNGIRVLRRSFSQVHLSSASNSSTAQQLSSSPTKHPSTVGHPPPPTGAGATKGRGKAANVERVRASN